VDTSLPWVIRGYLERLLPIVTLAALVSLALEFGFYDPRISESVLIAVQLVAVGVYAVVRVLQVWTAARRWVALRRLWYDVAILAAAGVVVLLEFEFSSSPVVTLSMTYVALMQTALALGLVVKVVRINLALSQRVLQPTRFVLMTFVVLILLGTIALALPKAMPREFWQDGGVSLPKHLLNCAFTATSATCVTGLVVYDTGSDFTFYGQVVILLLIQLGGLGIMVFGSVMGILAGRQLSLRHSLVLQDETSYHTLGEMRTLVKFIMFSTFVIEAVGVVVVYPLFSHIPGFGDRLFHAVFHSISAFCNAGFALQSDSLVSFQRSWPTYLGIMPLIILGGLGFPVLRDLWQGVVQRFEDRSRRRRGVPFAAPPPKRWLSLHSRLVLVTTAVLIVAPTFLFVLFETFQTGAADHSTTGRAFAELTPVNRLLNAMFLSVTCRTAGFNTVPMDSASLSPASHMLAAILMFIGGSPGSTAGGIKTSSLAVMILAVWATLRGRQHVEAFGRRISEVVVRRAGAVMVVMVALVSVGTLTLCFTEGVSLREALFETVSAAGTVGLSTGMTPDLTLWGRAVIIVTMLAGRLGPLTVLVAMAGVPHPVRYEYPKEDVVIG